MCYFYLDGSVRTYGYDVLARRETTCRTLSCLRAKAREGLGMGVGGSVAGLLVIAGS